MIEPSELPYGEPGYRPKSVHWASRMHRLRVIARRYWWIAALTIMIGLGIEDYRNHYQVPRYFSTARMIMNGRLSLPEGNVYSEGDELANFFGTQVALMQSPSTYSQATDRVTAIHPEVTADDSAIVEASVEPRTSIFDLKVTSNNADYAKLLLDAVMDTYLDGKRGRKNQTTDEAVSAITDEISRLEADIQKDESDLLDFQKKNNVVFIEQQSSSSAAYLVGLNNELAKLIKQRDLLLLENKDPLLGANYNQNTAGTMTVQAANPSSAPGATTPSKSPSTPPADGANTPVDTFTEANPILEQQDRIEQLKIKRDQLGIYLKDKHPKMIELADAIDKEQKFLDVLTKRDATQREALCEDLNLQIKNLQQQIDTSNANSLKLSESLADYQQLKDKLTREQGLYNQLSMSNQNVDFNKSLDQEDVVIMEAASRARPIPPDNFLRLLYGLGGGLAAGVVLIYFISRLDDKVDSAEQLEDAFDLPVVGQIPRVHPDKKTKRVPLLTESDQRHEFLEYHRNLRSAILFQSAEATKFGSLMICSTAPGEGKSTLAANMAIVFAHSGLNVLLIDADLRRGVQHNLFDLPSNQGLSEYLRGEISWPEVVQETNVTNLSVMPRGKVLYRAGDLLLGAATDTLLQESAAVFDIVLWDSAPLLAAHDAANLCSKVDGILYVARVRKSTLSAIRSALEDLSQRNAKILGFVLNAVEHHQTAYFGKYRYKEYYETSASS